MIEILSMENVIKNTLFIILWFLSQNELQPLDWQWKGYLVVIFSLSENIKCEPWGIFGTPDTLDQLKSQNAVFIIVPVLTRMLQHIYYQYF